MIFICELGIFYLKNSNYNSRLNIGLHEYIVK